jgi:hypothetical protein
VSISKELTVSAGTATDVALLEVVLNDE